MLLLWVLLSFILFLPLAVSLSLGGGIHQILFKAHR